MKPRTMVWLLALAGGGALIAPDVRAIELSLGDAGNCYLKEGQVLCWGSTGEFVGKPWDSLDIERVPVPRRGLDEAVRIAVGDEHACALRRDGTLRCWGFNDDGQIGNGQRVGRYPIDIPKPALTEVHAVVGITGASAVAVGTRHSCAVVESGVRCWGDDESGAVTGVPSRSKPSPQGVPGVTGVDAIACGDGFSCAFKRGGAAWCWGTNDSGELGDELPEAKPRKLRLAKANAVALGQRFGCALEAGGSVRCWGDGSGLASRAITKLDLPKPAVAIDAAGGSFCAVIADGRVFCGGDMGWALGGGASEAMVEVPGLKQAKKVFVGSRHACALLAGDELRCWGDRARIGLDTPHDAAKPVAVRNLDDALDVVVHEDHTCALRRGGVVSCWGGGDFDDALPHPVAGASGLTSLSLGRDFACGLTKKGPLCWGANASSQLARTATRGRLPPTVLTSLADAAAISAGQAHGCAVTKSGDVRCWGAAHDGVLGRIDADEYPAPVATPADVEDLPPMQGVDAGRCSSCAIARSGAVHCWGCNREGLCGNGRLERTSLPHEVVGVSDAVQLTIGGLACARSAAGKVSCWGDSAFTAVPFQDVDDAIDVSSGDFGVCVARRSGQVRCGRPGKHEPIAGLQDATHVAVGRHHACATRADGTAICWGERRNGVLGDGNPDYYVVPQLIAVP
jgi:alpha-tubulin suppressor-like RCC1 family protein